MKPFLIFFIALTSFNLFADETRVFKKENANEASVSIKTEEQDSTQAAAYVDGQENAQFIAMMLKDKESELSKLKAKIELQFCDTNSTEDNPWIDGCGEVTLTEMVLTAFGRGGWMSAGAGRTFFVGFTEDGTGHFFTASHMITINEDVEAQVNSDGDYTGEVIKHLSMSKIVELPKEN